MIEGCEYAHQKTHRIGRSLSCALSNHLVPLRPEQHMRMPRVRVIRRQRIVCKTSSEAATNVHSTGSISARASAALVKLFRLGLAIREGSPCDAIRVRDHVVLFQSRL